MHVERLRGRAGEVRARIALSNKRPHRDILGWFADIENNPALREGFQEAIDRLRRGDLFQKATTNLLKAEILVDRTDKHTSIVYIEPSLHAEHRRTRDCDELKVTCVKLADDQNLKLRWKVGHGWGLYDLGGELVEVGPMQNIHRFLTAKAAGARA